MLHRQETRRQALRILTVGAVGTALGLGKASEAQALTVASPVVPAKSIETGNSTGKLFGPNGEVLIGGGSSDRTAQLAPTLSRNNNIIVVGGAAIFTNFPDNVEVMSKSGV